MDPADLRSCQKNVFGLLFFEKGIHRLLISKIHLFTGTVDKIGERLFQQKSLFLKPLCGNQKVGTYGLEYHSSTDSYSLVLSEDNTVDSREEIITFFKSLTEKPDYLVQPLLLNHPDVQKLSEYHSLITFRVITVWAENRAQPISAIAEFPVNDNSEYVYPFPVDLQNGTILAIKEKAVAIKKEIDPKFEHVPGHLVIHWHELVDIAEKAHAVFPICSASAGIWLLRRRASSLLKATSTGRLPHTS